MSRSWDLCGMECLRGESDAEYVVLLKEGDAPAHMAAKFGNCSGLNGNGRMSIETHTLIVMEIVPVLQ